MKKLSLEGFFHPELPGNQNKHKFSRQPSMVGSNDFPYTGDAGETLEEDEIERELELKEFYKAGPTMPARDNLSIGRISNSQGVPAAGKGSKSFANFLTKKNKNNNNEKSHALDVEYENYKPEDDFKEFDEYFQTESLSLIEFYRGARETATKELGRVTTKQPWTSGIPNETEDDDEKLETLKIEKDLGLNLESIMKEYADSDWSRGMQGKRCRGDKDDLNFFSDLEDSSPYLMNSLEDIEVKDEEDES